VFDASVLIELAYATNLGEKALKLMKQRDIYTTEFAIAETFYILCRKLGEEEAKKKVNDLLASGFIDLLYVSPFEAGRIKCKRAISLADCYAIALAEKVKGCAVFAKKEEEMMKEIERKEFPIPIVFLEDL